MNEADAMIGRRPLDGPPAGGINARAPSLGGPPIETVDVAVFRIPTEAPEEDGTLRWDHTTVVTVEVGAGGERGLGFTYGTSACKTLIDELLVPVMTGGDALDVGGNWLKMVRAIRNHGRPGVASMAIAALDIAGWDLKARLAEQSLAGLLGGVRRRVPVYGSGGFTSYTDEELTDQLARWVHSERIPQVKMKIGTAWGTRPGRDLERVARARDAVGPDAELFVDANGAYTAKQAVRLAGRLEELGVTWFEEPVSSDDLAGLATVRSETTIDVAAGEYGYDLAYFARMCGTAAGGSRAGGGGGAGGAAVDVLQADVSRCAGITEWLRVAAVAAAAGLDLSGHCAPSLHAHVACVPPNVRHVEWFHDHVRVDRILFDGVLDPAGGAIEPDLDRPGMGLTLKVADAEPYRVG